MTFKTGNDDGWQGRKMEYKEKQIKKAFIWIMTASLVLAGCGGETADKTESETAVIQEEEKGLTLEDLNQGTSSRPEIKEETVQVKTTADGMPKEIKVNVRLSGAGESDFIADVTNLTEIRNTEGDEEYIADGSNLYWENHGTDIVYEGISSDELPFEVKITYYLNGKETEPSEMAGKSGDIRIRFDYVNHTYEEREMDDKTVKMTVPMTAITMVMLPEEVFQNAEVTNGKLVNIGDQRLALGVAMPGLAEDLELDTLEMTEDIDIPEYVEIRARAEKFELDFTATIVSPGLLSENDEEKDKDDDKDNEEIFEDIKELEDASGELEDGASELADGASEFGDGLNAYTDGASELADGAVSLSEGAANLNGSSGSLRDGAGQLASGLSELVNTLSGIDTAGLSEMSKTDLSSLLEKLNGIDLSGLEETIRAVLGDEAADQIAALSAMIEELKSAITALQALPAAAGKLAETLPALQEGVSVLSAGASDLSSGINAYTDGVSALSGGASSLADGAEELASSGTELKEGYEELLEGIGKLKDGIGEFNEEGIRELVSLVNEDIKNVYDRFQTVKELDAEYRNFSGIAKDQEGTVRFIFESESI